MKCAICANRKIEKLLVQKMLPAGEHGKLVFSGKSVGAANVLLVLKKKQLHFPHI